MPATVWFAPWKPGPAAHLADDGDVDGGVLVSVTEFTPHRPWTAVCVSAAGLALRRTWQDVDGAVGLWLWVAPDLPRPRSGSVSVWRDEKDLTGFVTRPDHLRIMRAYRRRGVTRSATWRTERFAPDAAQEAARALLTGRTPWPRPDGARRPRR
ncbi:hypothetical protein GCM10010266_30310 [Streptomyces griseomycini]|uniref:hypothetical protein n=1 Tax=Streptomyces griseomycini TaxID=66895 RepID=UPI0018774768|nr:hypothetical protein [Streptomyces griseomycini]GGQ04640.1 hypothetical protein GCM10010266_30310 [Streptomyces griseomycini]